VRYLRATNSNTVLVLCESFQDELLEWRISQYVTKDIKRIFLALRLDGDDYQIDIYYGHPSNIESAKQWDNRVFAYANDDGAVKINTGFDKQPVRELMDGKGETWGMKWNGAIPDIYQIREFTLPPVEQTKNTLRRNIERLPASFENSIKTQIEDEGIEWGFAFISPVANASMEYEIIILKSERYSHEYFRYYLKSKFKNPFNHSSSSHSVEEVVFSVVGYHSMKLSWFLLSNRGDEFLDTLVNPLFSKDELTNLVCSIGSTAIACKYLELGAVFFFVSSPSDFTMIRIK